MRSRHYLILDCEPRLVLRFMAAADLFAYCGVAAFALEPDRLYTLDRRHNGCCPMRVALTVPRREQPLALPRVDNRWVRSVDVEFAPSLNAQFRAALAQ